MGALALYVPIGQKAPLLRAVELLLYLVVQVAVLQKPQEKVLRDPVMVLRIGVGEQVKGQAYLLIGVQKGLVVALKDLLGRDTLFVGAHGDGRAVGIGSRDHQDVVALQSLVAGKDIGRQIGAGQVPQVLDAVGVGPGHAE